MGNLGTAIRATGIGVASAAMILVSSPSFALTIGTSSWTEFNFNGAGSSLYDPSDPDPSNPTLTTFTTGFLSQSMNLQVSDAYFPGDIFKISVKGVSPVTTSTVTTSTPPCSGNSCTAPILSGLSSPINVGTKAFPIVNDRYNEAFNDGLFSTATILLVAGNTYDITGIVTNDIFGGGAGAFELVTAAPLPASWTFMGLGLAGLWFFARRRNSNNALAA
jgi:hypothetical protein